MRVAASDLLPRVADIARRAGREILAVNASGDFEADLRGGLGESGCDPAHGDMTEQQRHADAQPSA